MTAPRADIGIFGGSGFYSLLPNVEEVWIQTPYGAPSDRVALAEVAGRRVAFLPRHGKDHRFPPHMINYRANLWAMKELGVSRVLAPCACGSLQPHIKPGEFVVMDQLVDRTTGRKDTFFDGPVVQHPAVADPYCPELRPLAAAAGRAEGITIHDEGTMVVIQGPRFSTRAESRWFTGNGWHTIGMTQYPECILARELNMCYVGIGLVTDFDAGLEGQPDILPVTHEEVIKVFTANVEKLRRLLMRLIGEVPVDHRACACGLTIGHGVGH